MNDIPFKTVGFYYRPIKVKYSNGLQKLFNWLVHFDDISKSLYDIIYFGEVINYNDTSNRNSSENEDKKYFVCFMQNLIIKDFNKHSLEFTRTNTESASSPRINELYYYNPKMVGKNVKFCNKTWDCEANFYVTQLELISNNKIDGSVINETFNYHKQ